MTATLTSNRTNPKGWPTTTTMSELVVLAKAKLGSRYLGVYRATYGGGSQIEVRSKVSGYHGWRMSRVAIYQEAVA